MPKITNIANFIEGAQADVKEVLQGYQSLWQGLAETDTDPPVAVNLTNQTITAEAEFYMAGVSGGAISSLEKIAGMSKQSLTVSIDADQTSNTGAFTVFIPENLYTAEIPPDASTLPLAVIYFKRTAGQEIRISRTVIGFRRGSATDG